MVRPYFKNTEHEKLFFENGYLLLPFLEPDEVAELHSLYSRFMPLTIEDLYASTLFNTAEVNREVNEAIRQILNPATARICEAGKLLGGSFLVKSPLHSTNLPLHQDWNIVDETTYASAMLWCPLQDTTQENGTLYVLPGSHRFFTNYRSGAMPSRRIPITPALQPYVKTINVKAGEVLVYHPALFHGSHPNQSKKLRIVAAGSTVHADAALVYYHLNRQTGQIEVYAADNDFYLNVIPLLEEGKLPPDAILLQTLAANLFYPDAADLLAKLVPSAQAVKLPETGYSYSFWRRLKTLIGSR
ncbi:hypothetical protein C7N43_26965 [Sphingobacteriales bacterium UPWRP_1]|nr:hypothetical protein B6N25_16400 [Sphingobacteriales bacterium TSM_CSS]PSJ73858.1 hypothetical protein C7N43_26965 [Sphingobacteriales bacterium UPWRP_1]